MDGRQAAPVSLIAVISWAIKQPGPGQPLKEGPVSPGQVCAGSLAAQLLLHTQSGLWQVARALLRLGPVPSLPGLRTYSPWLPGS